MNIISSKTLEYIQQRYKFTINTFEEAEKINDSFVGKIMVSLKDYNFMARIEKLRLLILKKEPKLDDEKKNFYIAKLDDLAIKVAESKGEMIGVHFQTECFFFDLRDNYIMNINKPFALDTYIKICKDILDKEANKYINKEKIFIYYNETLNDLYNKLT